MPNDGLGRPRVIPPVRLCRTTHIQGVQGD